MRLLQREPELRSINARVRQKPLAQRAAKALIRCDGDSDIGLGHVYRCLALADELRERQGSASPSRCSEGRRPSTS